MNSRAIFSLVLLLIAGASAQQQIECEFIEDSEVGYTCWIIGANVTDPNEEFVIGGEHADGRTNEDVVNVEVMGGQMVTVPMILFDTFPNMELLDVSASGVETLQPFRNCARLTVFLAYFNHIESVPANTFAECQNLTLLTLAGNRISQFDGAGLDNLVELGLGDNRLTNLNTTFVATALHNLEVLFLSNNNIEEMHPDNFVGMPNLKQLFLSSNNLTTLHGSDFVTMPELEIISLYNNHIRDVGMLLGIGKLQQLDLGLNEISRIGLTFIGLNDLEVLLLDHNHLTLITNTDFQSNFQLRTLSLYDNQIEFIEDAAFASLENIEQLNLVNNICINMNFNLTGGSIHDIIPELDSCLPRDFDTLTCTFENVEGLGYTCFVESGTVRAGRRVEFAGTHLDDRTDEDVTRIFFLRSSLERVPMEIFDTFVNMDLIDVSASNLDFVNEFSNCESLNSFYASWNQLTVIPRNTFAACTNLTRLILSNNQITEFHGTGLEGLVELRLDNNQISSFSMDSFGTLENLEILWMTRNEITFIYPETIFALSNLRELFLGYNQISTLFAGELSPLIHLQRLSLYRNRINRIHQDAFLGLTEVHELDLGNNQIEDLGQIFSHMPGLERVYLDGNRVEMVRSEVFRNNTELIEIDLHNNQIRIIEVGVFDHLQNLVELYLSDNRCVNENFVIDPPGNLTGVLPSLQQCLPPAEVRLDCTFREHDIGYTCWITDAFMVEGVPVSIGTDNHLAGRTNNDVQRVEILLSRMTHVPLELFDTFPNLRIFDASGNRLPRIDPLRNCRLMHTFFGSFNDLEVIPADTFTECVSLTSLTLSNNRINEFHSNGLTGVQHLNLNRNELNEVTSETFGYLENLETLWLSNNQIEQIFPVMFVSMTNLRELLLINNNIRRLLPEEFNPLVNLEVLSVYGNFIEEISDVAFDNLGNLRALDLGSNRLSNLGTPFSVLPRLERVFMDNNDISRIASNLFENNRDLIEIDIHNNNITLIEANTFNHLHRLDILTLRGNGCVDEDFTGINGDVVWILPRLAGCLPSAQLQNMVCTFDLSIGGYSCQVGDGEAFMVRSILIN